MEDWLRRYYDEVDSMNLNAHIAWHTDDVVVRFGNNPPVIGKAAMAEAIGHFFTTIGGMRHKFGQVHTDGDSTVLEADIEYTRLDGNVVEVVSASVLHRRGDLVDSLKIYIDLAPVFALEAAGI